MRRTQWAVFTSMNPRPSAWRALYEPAPAAAEPMAGEEKAETAVSAAPDAEPVRPATRFDL